MTPWIPQGRDRRILLAAIGACTALIYVYPLFLPTPLIDPDEGQHALIAQEMVETGDYVIPRIFGEPFRDKPILYSFCQAVSLRMFGMSEWAVRLPGYLFALLGVLTTWVVARRLFDESTALAAALIGLTLITPMILSQAAVHDIALVPWTNLLFLCLYQGAQDARPRWRLVAAFSVLLALAVLTKGLIGVAVVAVGFGAFVVLVRRLTWELAARFGLGVVAGMLLASPWFLAMEAADPGYLFYYFIERHFLGFATATQTHGLEPWHYYLPWVLGGTVPWIWYAVGGLADIANRGRNAASEEKRAAFFLVCWFVGGLLFLSTAKSKLMTYSLPLYPSIAILAAYGWSRFASGFLSPRATAVMAWILRLGAAVGIAAPIGLLLVVGSVFGTQFPVTAFVAAGVVSAFAIVLLWTFERGQNTLWLAGNGLWLAAMLALAMTWPVQSIAASHSQRALAERIDALPEPPSRIYIVGERLASVIFYVDPELRRALRCEQLKEAAMYEVNKFKSLPSDVFIAIAVEELPNSQSELLREAETIPAGPFRVLTTQSREIRRTASVESSAR